MSKLTEPCLVDSAGEALNTSSLIATPTAAEVNRFGTNRHANHPAYSPEQRLSDVLRRRTLVGGNVDQQQITDINRLRLAAHDLLAFWLDHTKNKSGILFFNGRPGGGKSTIIEIWDNEVAKMHGIKTGLFPCDDHLVRTPDQQQPALNLPPKDYISGYYDIPAIWSGLDLLERSGNNEVHMDFSHIYHRGPNGSYVGPGNKDYSSTGNDLRLIFVDGVDLRETAIRFSAAHPNSDVFTFFLDTTRDTSLTQAFARDKSRQVDSEKRRLFRAHEADIFTNDLDKAAKNATIRYRKG